MKENFSDKAQKFGKRFIGKGFKGKGFYIALLLCVIAIGSVGYYTLKNSFDFSPDQLDIGNQINDSYNDLEQQTDTPDQISPVNKNVNGVEDSTSTAEVKNNENNTDLNKQNANEAKNNSGSTEDKSTKQNDTKKTESKPTSFIMPVNGEIITPYALEDLVYSNTMQDWRTHNGVDIKAALGAKILASADGKVESVSEDALMGKTIVIAHSGGIKTIYSNIGAIGVKVDQKVTMGQKIGDIGQTAIAEYADTAHLHISIMEDGNYVDPMGYIKK